jgi:hypothetical protein
MSELEPTFVPPGELPHLWHQQLAKYRCILTRPLQERLHGGSYDTQLLEISKLEI